MAGDLKQSWMDISRSIDSVRNSLRKAFDEQQKLDGGLSSMEKASRDFAVAATAVSRALASTGKVTGDLTSNFAAAARGIRIASKEARELELRYKGLEMAALGLGGVLQVGISKMTGWSHSLKDNVAYLTGATIGVNALRDASVSFRRSLFEADKITERFGGSLGDLASAFDTIRSQTEISKRDFAELNNQVKQLYLTGPSPWSLNYWNCLPDGYPVLWFYLIPKC